VKLTSGGEGRLCVARAEARRRASIANNYTPFGAVTFAASRETLTHLQHTTPFLSR